MSSAGDWPVVILACGHVASVQEAMRKDVRRFCLECCKWVEVDREV